MTKNQRIARFYENMASYGIKYEDVDKLRRIEMALHNWCEKECGNGNDYQSWSIERDEKTKIPYMCIYPNNGEMRKYRVADRETGALKRLEKIMTNYPHLQYYYQTDCRGVALYLVKKSDIEGKSVDQYYTRGLAITY